MKSLLGIIRETFIICIVARVSSGTPVYQDRGRSLQRGEFSSDGPESQHGRIGSHYEGLSSKLPVQQDLYRSWDSTNSQSQQEGSKSDDSRSILNRLMTGSFYGSSKNSPISAQNGKVQVEKNQEPDHRPLNVPTSSLAQIVGERHAHEVHITTAATLADLPGASSLVMGSDLEKMPYKFFAKLEYLRQKVFDVAEKIEKLRTSSGESIPAHELHPGLHSSPELNNLSESSAHPSILDLKNEIESLGSQLNSLKFPTPEPSMLSIEAAINPVGIYGNDSFINVINYLRNRQTKGIRGHEVISEVPPTILPAHERDYPTNGPDKVMEPSLKSIDSLKEFLDKVASKEDKYVDIPVQFSDDEAINQDPDRYLKLLEELTKQQKVPNEARKGEISDSGEDAISSDVVLNSNKPVLYVPVSSDPINTEPTSIKLISESDMKSTSYVPTSTNPGEGFYADMEPTDTELTNIKLIISESDLMSSTHVPISTNLADELYVDMEPTDTEPANIKPIISELDLMSSTHVPISMNPGDRVYADMEPFTKEPTSIKHILSESDLKSTTHVSISTNPGEVVLVDMETTNTEPTSISESDLMSTTHEFVGMNPGNRVPVDEETTTINPAGANFVSPNSTIIVHLPTEPSATDDSNPDVIIATPATYSSSKPGTTVQETVATIADDKQIASKIARDGVERTPLQYHDHTVLLVGLLVAGMACAAVFVGACILCRVRHRRKKLKEQGASGYLKPRYTYHNTLAR